MIGRALRAVLFLAALAFVLKTAWELSRAWDSQPVSLVPAWLALAVALNSASLYCQGVAFLKLLESWLGRELDRVPALSVHFASQLARYTPGKVGLPGVRLAGVSALGGSKEQVLSATIIEVLVWLIVGCFVALSLFAIHPFALITQGSPLHFALLSLPLPLGALALMAGRMPWSSVRAWIHRLRLPFAARLSGARDESPLAPNASFAWFLAHWLLIVLTGAAVCLALRGAWSAAIPSGVTLVLAIVLGFLALFAPGGVGIREAALAACAAPLVGAKEATLLGILARAVSLTSELLLWSAFRIAVARGRR